MNTTTVYFDHIYHTSGFDISAEFTSDGKEYKAKKVHACLDHGYWCFDNFKENPFKIFLFIKNKIYSRGISGRERH